MTYVFLAVPQWQLYAAFPTNNNRFYANFGPSFWTTFIYLGSWPKIPKYRTSIKQGRDFYAIFGSEKGTSFILWILMMPGFEAWNDLFDLAVSAHGSVSSNPGFYLPIFQKHKKGSCKTRQPHMPPPKSILKVKPYPLNPPVIQYSNQKIMEKSNK